jgi:hypothetical protein
LTNWTWQLIAASVVCALWAVSHRFATQRLMRLLAVLAGSHPHRAMSYYAWLTWPGTVVHELAHWLAAVALGVQAGMPHLIPGKPNEHGETTLGYVPIAQTDPLRQSVIGVAPFVAGCAAVFLLSRQTGLLSLVELPWAESLAALWRWIAQPATPLYVYLLFAITQAMVPSESDRTAWPAVALLMVLGGIAAWWLGWTPPGVVQDWAQRGVYLLTIALGLVILFNGLLLLFVYLVTPHVIAWRALRDSRAY